MATPTWIVIDLSEDPPVETERKATPAEISAAAAHRKAVEAREAGPPLTLEQRLATLESAIQPKRGGP